MRATGYALNTMAALVVALWATPAAAQAPMPPPGGPMGGTMLMGVDPGPMGRVVKGAPFSAEAVTVASQTLADGNVIERTFTATLARDGDGRVRTEQTIALVGPLSTGGAAPRMTTIADPVAGVHYMLDESRRLALRRPFGAVPPPPPPGGERPRGPRPEGPPREPRPDAVPPPPPGSVEEALGTKEIAGLEATGTRVTTTIPAGAMGNARPIVLVMERWVSTALSVPVRIVRRDPRMGDTLYELRKVVRGEPDAALFQVPTGYTVQDDRPGQGPRPPGEAP